MLRPLLALLALLIGCGASDEPSCGFEDGVYTASYRALNGDCPDIPLRVVSPGAIPPACKQTFTYDDKCAVNSVRECEQEGRYGRYVLDLEPTGSGYIGLYQVDDPSCSGLYDVTYIVQ